MIVATERCSDAELLAKANELNAHAEGCQKHAAELRRYVETRGANAVAAE